MKTEGPKRQAATFAQYDAPRINDTTQALIHQFYVVLDWVNDSSAYRQGYCADLYIGRNNYKYSTHLQSST